MTGLTRLDAKNLRDIASSTKHSCLIKYNKVLACAALVLPPLFAGYCGMRLHNRIFSNISFQYEREIAVRPILLYPFAAIFALFCWSFIIRPAIKTVKSKKCALYLDNNKLTLIDEIILLDELEWIEFDQNDIYNIKYLIKTGEISEIQIPGYASISRELRYHVQ